MTRIKQLLSVILLALLASGAVFASDHDQEQSRIHLNQLTTGFSSVSQIPQLTAQQIQNIVLHSGDHVGKTFKAVGNIGYRIGNNAKWKNNVLSLFIVDGKGDSIAQNAALVFERNMFTRARAENFAERCRARQYSMWDKEFEILPNLDSTFIFQVIARDNSGSLPLRLISITHPNGEVIRF